LKEGEVNVVVLPFSDNSVQGFVGFCVKIEKVKNQGYGFANDI